MSALRRLAARPSSAASIASDQYFGPGISIQDQPDTPPLTRASALEKENQALREQVQHLQHLLTLINPDHDNVPSTSTGSNSSKPPRTQPLQPLQRHKAQIAQLQRQVNTLQAELHSRNAVCLEADAIIHEASRRLEPLLAATRSSSTGSNGRTPATAGGATSAGASQSSAARAGFGRSGGVAGGVAGARSAAGPDSSQHVLQECGELAAWCKHMQHRLGRARAQASSAFRRSPSEDNGSWSSSKGRQHSADDGLASLPYIAAGGNRFLLQHHDGAHLTIPALCAGKGMLLADPSRVHALEVQLGKLAPALASLAVALRSVLLPAMPWLSRDLGQQLQGEVAETAEAAATAAAGLAELACLLPSTSSLAGAAPAAAAKRAAAKAAARDGAGDWGGAGVQWDGNFGVAASGADVDPGEAGISAADQAAGTAGLSDEQQQLFERLEAALAAQAGSSYVDEVHDVQRHGSGGSGLPRFSSIRGQGSLAERDGGSPSRTPSRTQSRAAGTAAPSSGAGVNASSAAAAARASGALRKLRLCCMVQAWQRRVLDVKLGFVAEASGAHARLVSELVVAVVEAIKASTGAATAESEASERRQLLIAVQSLTKAARLVEARPGDAAYRGAVECLLRHADALELMSEVLEHTAAPAVQAAAIAAAQHAYAEYTSCLHAAQARCSASSKHVKHQAAVLQRQTAED